MAGFPLGSFAGGLTQGIDGGALLAERLRQQKEAQILRQAQAAAGQAMVGPPQGPQPPPPGAPSAPGAPQGGTAPPGPPMPPQPGAPPNLGAMGGASPPPMPRPNPNTPPAGTAAGPAAGPVGGQPLSGTAAPSGGSDLQAQVLDANNTIKALAQSIKASNPGIEPRALFLATMQTIDAMKGIQPAVRDYMQEQVKYAQLQQRHEDEMAKQKEDMEKAIAKIQEDRDKYKALAESREAVARTQAGARVQAAQIGGASREAAAATGAGARRYAADVGAQSRENVAETQAESRAATEDTAALARLNAARAGMNQPPLSALPGGPTPRRAPRAATPSNAPPVAGARKAPDGHWYVQKNGQYFRVE